MRAPRDREAMLDYDYSLATRETAGDRGADVSLDARALRGIEAFRALAGRERESFASAVDGSLDAVLVEAERIRGSFTDLVIIGIGGSALGSKSVYNALVRRTSGRRLDGSARDGVRLHYIENVDPIDTLDILETLPFETTAFNVITKSGGTVETMSSFFTIRERLIGALGLEGYRQRMLATTDPAVGILRRLVKDDGLRSLSVPAGVGGRFSVFTPVGTLPLAAAGLDVAAFQRGAVKARDAALIVDSLEANPAAAFACLQVALYERGVTDVVLMPYATSMRDVANWFVQLWAESLGKVRDGASVGPTPIPAVGATDQHSQLQLFMEGPATKNIVFCSVLTPAADQPVPAAPAACASLDHLSGKTFSEIQSAELEGVKAALKEVGRPSSTFELERLDEESIGALMMTLCAAAGMAGEMLGVNPYDQPGVELAKKFAHGILGREAERNFAERLVAANVGLVRRRSSIG
jgi:glucose-6-phosphate isomerase